MKLSPSHVLSRDGFAGNKREEPILVGCSPSKVVIYFQTLFPPVHHWLCAKATPPGNLISFTLLIFVGTTESVCLLPTCILGKTKCVVHVWPKILLFPLYGLQFLFSPPPGPWANWVNSSSSFFSSPFSFPCSSFLRPGPDGGGRGKLDWWLRRWLKVKSKLCRRHIIWQVLKNVFIR